MISDYYCYRYYYYYNHLISMIITDGQLTSCN